MPNSGIQGPPVSLLPTPCHSIGLISFRFADFSLLPRWNAHGELPQGTTQMVLGSDQHYYQHQEAGDRDALEDVLSITARLDRQERPHVQAVGPTTTTTTGSVANRGATDADKRRRI